MTSSPLTGVIEFVSPYHDIWWKCKTNKGIEWAPSLYTEKELAVALKGKLLKEPERVTGWGCRLEGGEWRVFEKKWEAESWLEGMMHGE